VKNDRTPVDYLLAELPRPDSNAARQERVRSRCHNELARRPRPRSPVLRLTPMRRRVETVLVGGFCAAYLCALALQALHSHGWP
jgi:hypothetical protein